jgi:hypothetical protein
MTSPTASSLSDLLTSSDPTGSGPENSRRPQPFLQPFASPFLSARQGSSPTRGSLKPPRQDSLQPPRPFFLYKRPRRLRKLGVVRAWFYASPTRHRLMSR